MQWTTIDRLIDEHDHRGLTTALLALTDKERKSFAAPLRDKGAVPRGEFLPWESQPFFALAGAGIVASPSALASWLRRLELTYWQESATPELAAWGHREPHDVVDDMLQVLEARDVPWLGDLAVRLAAAIRVTRMDRARYELADRLRAAADIAPPETEGYLVSMFTWAGPSSFVQHTRDDARFAALVPRLAEIAAIGSRVSDTGASDLAQAAAEGLLDRTVLLDAVIGSLQRGGRTQELRGWLRLYDSLRPTVDELADRHRDLLPVLEESPANVAAVVQSQLFALDDAGRLPEPAFVETAAASLRRSEKKLVRAQLQRLDLAVAAGRVTPGVAADAAAEAFALGAVDLQRDAVRRIVGWASDLDASRRTHVLAAADVLPADLRGELSTAFGVSPAIQPDPAVPADLPTKARMVPFVPTTDIDVLAEEFLAIGGRNHVLDPLTVERQAEALVRFAREERTALRTAFSAVLASPLYTHWARPSSTLGGTTSAVVEYGLVRVLAAAVGDPAIPVGRPDAIRDSVLQQAVFERLLTLADDLRSRPGPLLVSAPSDTRGVIDPADLLARLRTAAVEGWEPWTDDLDVALLRLDRAAAVGPYAPEAFEVLGTSAGRAVGERLRTPPPEAGVTVGPVERTVPERSWMGPESPTVVERWYLARVASARDAERHGRFWTTATTALDPSDNRQVWLHWIQHFDAPGCWTVALPWHPEVVATGVAALYAIGTSHANPRAGAIVGLAEAPGLHGDSTALAILLAASAKNSEARAAATDALLVLAAHRRLDPVRVGSVLAVLLDGGHVTLTRVLGPLRDATDAGAGRFVWEILAAALPTLLRSEPPLPKFADVLEVAARAASAASATGSIDGLDDFAARKGGSRQVVEARRLRDLLASEVRA